MSYSKRSCVEVGKGGVGESGVSTMLHHVVTGASEFLMVLSNAGSSLCPDTGALGVLLVNGTPVAHGMITAAQSSIQANAQPGDSVIAMVHTVPLFNGIVCVQVGELDVTLEQCDVASKS